MACRERAAPEAVSGAARDTDLAEGGSAPSISRTWLKRHSARRARAPCPPPAAHRPPADPWASFARLWFRAENPERHAAHTLRKPEPMCERLLRVRKTRSDAAMNFIEFRVRMMRGTSLDKFVAGRRWRRRFKKTKRPRGYGTSYGLKHVAEREIGYITNGVFIAAAIAEGFVVRRVKGTPNARIGISRAAWRGGD